MIKWMILLLVIECKGDVIIDPCGIFQVIDVIQSSNITMSCYYRPLKNITIYWFFNGSNVAGESSVAEFVKSQSSIIVENNIYTINIDSVRIEFHNTSVRCMAGSESSKEIYIHVHEQPPAVTNLILTVNQDNLLSINWTFPEGFLSEISYDIIQEFQKTSSRCVTEQTSILVGGITQGSCNMNAFPDSQCGDFNYTIAPIINYEDQNIRGPLSNKSLISKNISISYKRYKDNLNENFNVLLESTTAICTGICQWRRLNSGLDKNISEIILHSVVDDTDNYQYQYTSNLALPSGFRFELNLELNNSIDHLQKNIVISTHNIKDVIMTIKEPGYLNIRLIYFDNSSDIKWCFLTLLWCSNEDCEEIDYKKSSFILIKNEECNISYSSGYYQVHVFEVNSDGAINPSNISTAYPAFNEMKNFTINNEWKSHTSIPDNCSFVYENGQVCSVCTTESFGENSRQQIVLLPKDYNNFITNGITISEPGEVNAKMCLQNESDDYYAVVILVTPFDDVIYNQPIARGRVTSIPSYGTVGTTTTNNSISESSSTNFLLYTIPIIVIAVIAIIILQILAARIYLHCRGGPVHTGKEPPATINKAFGLNGQQ